MLAVNEGLDGCTYSDKPLTFIVYFISICFKRLALSELDCKTVRILAQESGWTWPEKDLERVWKLRVGLGRDAEKFARRAQYLEKKGDCFAVYFGTGSRERPAVKGALSWTSRQKAKIHICINGSLKLLKITILAYWSYKRVTHAEAFFLNLKTSGRLFQNLPSCLGKIAKN